MSAVDDCAAASDNAKEIPMPHHETVKVKGTVVDIFGHRFVLRTEKGKILADLTPAGAETLRLREGDEVEIAGERKPSEIKVARLARRGETFEIDHPPKRDRHPPRHHVEPDPDRALRGARAEGFAPLGRPLRRPKHFEILARDPDKTFVELHVEFDGHVRKTRPVDIDDPKWEDAIMAAEARQPNADNLPITPEGGAQ